MDGLVIHVSWEYFLGIMGALIGVAWYSGSRFTALETSMKWVKDILHELKTSSDNASNPAYGAHSPVNLNATGEAWLQESGLKEYLDKNKEYYIGNCDTKKTANPYEVQKHIFQIFDELVFDPALDDKLKNFAFSKGTSMGLLRRIGAIYLRNLCLERFGMNKEDIDRHDPANQTV